MTDHPGQVVHAGTVGVTDLGGEVRSFDDHYVLRDHVWPIFVEPRCKTCCHPDRIQIDQWLLDRYPRSEIVSWVDEDLSYDNLRSHWPAHGPKELLEREASLVRRGEDLGIDLDEHLGHYIDAVGAAHTLLNVGIQAVLDGKVVPKTYGEVTAAVALVDKIGQDISEDSDINLAMNQFLVIRLLQLIQDRVSPEVWAYIGEGVREDEMLMVLERAEGGDEGARQELVARLTKV